ncbi:MAG TPA: HAD family hydrolase [Candidatus Saccharimonadales bacterium]|nr:HAD family hydrolase [Candidatus Saccharimonadales bacterium]HSX27483.1 HAD family hydrolase [Patescibacteria group bacterium]
MKNRAVIFDIDGTAINSPQQKTPSQRLINAIREIEDSYYVCAATGRVWPFAKDILQALNLVDPCIISGGTQICNPADGEILWQSDLDPADFETALNIMKEYPDYLVIYNEYTEEDYLHGGTSPNEVKVSGPVYILEQKFIPKSVAPELVAKLSTIEGIACTLVTAQKPGVVDIHVTNRDATKEHTIAKLLEIIKVDKKNTIGIGDGYNDIHLFKAVNHKVAMENAEAELKARADEVIGHVSDDSFARYLERLAGK